MFPSHACCCLQLVPPLSFASCLVHKRLAVLCLVFTSTLAAQSTPVWSNPSAPAGRHSGKAGTHSALPGQHSSDIHPITCLVTGGTGTHTFLQIWVVCETHGLSITRLGPTRIFGWNNELLRIILGLSFTFEIQKRIHNIFQVFLGTSWSQWLLKKGDKKGRARQSPKQGTAVIHIHAGSCICRAITSPSNRWVFIFQRQFSSFPPAQHRPPQTPYPWQFSCKAHHPGAVLLRSSVCSEGLKSSEMATNKTSRPPLYFSVCPRSFHRREVFYPLGPR